MRPELKVFSFIEWVNLTSPAVKHPLLYSRKNAEQESSKFYSDLRNPSSLERTKYHCVNCHCSAVTCTMLISSYATWSTSETLASVQLPLNSSVNAAAWNR